MARWTTGIIAGFAFGIVDLIPMVFLNIQNLSTTMAAAFLNRFAIGFTIPNTTFPPPGWAVGILVALLFSIPDAIVTGAYGPILGFGVAGGECRRIDRTEKGKWPR